MTTQTQVSPKRLLVATFLGVITLLCVVLFYLSYGFVTWQVVAGVYDSPILLLATLLFTAVPAIICTVISLILVGPQRCKLAWISLCMYPLFFILMFILALCAPHH
jgi:hypothetical protein